MLRRGLDFCRHVLRKRSLPVRWPEFVIIGAAKCGTSSLYDYLVRHPDIVSARVKEVHYYDLHYGRGRYWYGAMFPRLPADGTAITGEASPYYLFHPLAPGRMAQDMPKVKIIVMLRNPADRTFSHYLHGVRLGYETLAFEEALEQEKNRLHGEEERILQDPACVSRRHRQFSYVSRGYYAGQLERWFRHFPREQFLLIRSEDFFADPDREYRRTLQFLSVAEHSLPTYAKVNASNGEVMPPAIRRQLTAAFAEPNQRLRELTGIDFDWR